MNLDSREPGAAGGGERSRPGDSPRNQSYRPASTQMSWRMSTTWHNGRGVGSGHCFFSHLSDKIHDISSASISTNFDLHSADEARYGKLNEKSTFGTHTIIARSLTSFFSADERNPCARSSPLLSKRSTRSTAPDSASSRRSCPRSFHDSYNLAALFVAPVLAAKSHRRFLMLFWSDHRQGGDSRRSCVLVCHNVREFRIRSGSHLLICHSPRCV